MTEVKEIIGNVDKYGKLEEFASHAAKGVIARFAGTAVIITIEQVYPRASGNQRRYYFKCIVEPIRQRFNEYGADMSKLEMHEWLKKNVGKIEKEVVAPNGEASYTVGSYRKLKKPEAEEYHEKCRMYGAKIGLQLMMPNEQDPLDLYQVAIENTKIKASSIKSLAE